jgi:hypothetical protein
VTRPWSSAPVVLFAVSLGLLLVAWAMSTRSFEGPDEPQHYLRALNLADGHLLGRRIVYVNARLTPLQYRFVNADSRAVDVPARMSPWLERCVNGTPDVTGCVEATPTGDYYPLAYLPSAGVLSVVHNADAGLWLSRLASAVVCGAFLVLAVWLLWDGEGWSLVGLFAAFTPMVLFTGSVINPSGIEIAASAAVAAGVLGIARSPLTAGRTVWIAVAVSGAVTILSWQAGPGFVLFDLAVGGAAIGRPGLRALRAAPRWPVLAGAALLVATGLWLAYAALSEVEHTPFGISPLWSSLRLGLGQIRVVLRESIGDFGELTVPLPDTVRALWLLFVAGLLAGAFVLGTRRERWLLAAVTILTLAFPVLTFAWLQRHSGFPLQGRYVLPVLMIVPLLSGEIIRHHRDTLTIAQAYAWQYNAARSSGSPSTIQFWQHAAFAPPGGWWPWIALTALATLATLACSLLIARDHTNPRPVLS